MSHVLKELRRDMISLISPTILRQLNAVYPKTGVIWSVYVKEVANKVSDSCKMDKIFERAMIDIYIRSSTQVYPYQPQSVVCHY